MSTSKYAPDDNHTYIKFIKGNGYCVFIKNSKSEKPIPDTCSNPNPSDSTAKWIESTVPVTYLLEEAKNIIQGKEAEAPT